MNSSAILDDMSKAWNRSPDGIVKGTDKTALSAALWSSRTDKTDEITCAPLIDQHIVCLQFQDLSADYFLDGRMRYSGRYAAGDSSIVPAGQRPRGLLHGKYSSVHLYVPNELLEATIRNEGLAVPAEGIEIVDPKRASDPLVQRIGREVVAEMQGNLPLSRLRVDALGMDLAVQLLRKYSGGYNAWSQGGSAPGGGGLTPWQMRRMEEVLASDLSQNHSLAALAMEIGLSPFHFARAFKQTAGVPPHAYLTRLRMERARSLLRGTTMPITEIAFEVGYESSQAFSRVFRKQFQCSPTDFRRDGWW